MDPINIRHICKKPFRRGCGGGAKKNAPATPFLKSRENIIPGGLFAHSPSRILGRDKVDRLLYCSFWSWEASRDEHDPTQIFRAQERGSPSRYTIYFLKILNYSQGRIQNLAQGGQTFGARGAPKFLPPPQLLSKQNYFDTLHYTLYYKIKNKQ